MIDHPSPAGSGRRMLFSLLLILAILLPQSAQVNLAQSIAPQRLFVTPSAAAPGGTIRLSGYQLPPGAVLSIQLLPQRGSPISIGEVTTSRSGMLAATLVLPRVPPGDYGLIAVDMNGAAVGSPAAFTVRAPPSVSLQPTSGPPGTTVTVSIGDLQPGYLRIDYAGAAVIGPIAVDASNYTGSFVVPNDRPDPLGAAASVVATNLVGDLMVGQGAAPFASQPGSATPQYRIADLTVATPQLRRGKAFTLQGKIAPLPIGPLNSFQITPFWADAAGRRFPISTAPATINPDGTFQVAAHVPSLLTGDPASAHKGDKLGVQLTLPGSTLTEQLMTFAADLPDLASFFTVQVVKDKPGAPDDGQPIPNTPTPPPGQPKPLRVRIEPVGALYVTQNQLDASFQLEDGTPAIDLAELHAHETIEGLINKETFWAANCYKEVSTIPRWEWVMDPDETVFASNWELPAVQTHPQQHLGAQAAQARPQLLDDATILVQTFKVTVDATRVVDGSQKGYGEVDDQHIFHPTIKYFVYVPDQGRVFVVDDTQTMATEVSHPAQIRLPPLPPGWKRNLSIESAEVADWYPAPTDHVYGNIYSFKSDPAVQFEQITPIRIKVKLHADETAVLNVHIKLDNTMLTVQKGNDKPPPPQSGNSPCSSGSSSVVYPDSFYDFYYADIPNSHMLDPGDHGVAVTADDGANTQDQTTLTLHVVPYQQFTDWFDNPQKVQNRRVKWYPGTVDLTGVPFDKNQSKAEIGEDVPKIDGPQNSAVKVGGEMMTSLRRDGHEDVQSQSGSMDGKSVDNAGEPLNYGSGSSVAVASEVTPQLTAADGEKVTILDTGKIRVAEFDYGIPHILSVGIAIDFRVTATAVINTTLQTDMGVGILLDSTVDLFISVDVDVLAGLGDAQVGFNPNIGVQIPVEFRVTQGKVDGGTCFHYGLDMFWHVDVLWGLVPVTDGTKTIFKGAAPATCYQQFAALQVAGPAAAQDSPTVPTTNPALATDGLGHTMAVWRQANGAIVASLLNGASWGAPQTIVNNGKSGNPAIAFFAPNQAVAVWTQSGLSAPPAPGTKLADIFKHHHMAYAVWNGTNWSAPQNLTLPTTGDGKVALAGCMSSQLACPAGGAVTAVWVHDAAGDIAEHQFRVYSARFQNGAWSAPQMVDGAGAASETEPAVVYAGGQPLALWVRDADRIVNSLADRRLALRNLNGGPTVLPSQIPSGVLKPNTAVDKNGALQVAFTLAQPGAGVVGNQHPLHRAVGATCGPQYSNCSWSAEVVKDGLGRTILAESPVVSVDSNNKVILTYRAMGMDPFAAPNTPVSINPEPVGLMTLTGELAQLELPAVIGSNAGMPSYSTDDGAVNWQPAAVYDPQINSTVALAVQGQAPAANNTALLLADRSLRPQAIQAPAPSLAFVAMPRIPNFVVRAITPGAPAPANGLPTRATVNVFNAGAGWQQQAGQPPLTIVATWDGPSGVGSLAGQRVISALDAGQASTIALDLQAPPGPSEAEHTLVITANPGQAITEASAADNSRRLKIGRLPAPNQLYAAATPGSANVFLTWQTAADPRIASYQIYRVDASGVHTPVGSSFTNQWVDTNVAFGQTYRYVVTSLGSGLTESPPSAAAAATPRDASPSRLLLPLVRR